MIGMIVAGHGNFGSGISSSLELIAGDLKDYQAIDFVQTDSIEDLEAKFNKAYESLKGCEGIIIFTDLVGGSPFKTAVMSSFGKIKAEVIAGTNLGMLIEINMARTFMDDFDGLVNMAISTGKDQVLLYEHKAVEQSVPTDGI